MQLIDAYSNCGICEKFEVIGGRGKYLKDGLHPDVEGQTLEGAFASKEIRNNYFKEDTYGVSGRAARRGRAAAI